MSQSVPIYDFEIPFSRVLGLRHETAKGYRSFNVLVADADGFTVVTDSIAWKSRTSFATI